LRRDRPRAGARRLRRRTGAPGAAAAAGGCILRPGDGQRRRCTAARQPPRAAAAAVRAPGQRRGDRAPVDLSTTLVAIGFCRSGGNREALPAKPSRLPPLLRTHPTIPCATPEDRRQLLIAS